MKRALISVYVKEDCEKLAKFLSEQGYEIVSSGGTYRYLKDHGIDAVEVSEMTGFPEVLGGRVKTLHPFVHAGILARQEIDSHMKDLEENNILPVDFVVCNLYPFEATIKDENSTPQEIIEKIDIGGVTLLRAAAKNFENVTVLVDNSDFDTVIEEMRSGGVSLETRQKLAMKAFNHTAYYDGMISTYFNRLLGNKFPIEMAVPMKIESSLRYGENPHQQAALYRSYIDKNASILDAEILWGKALSFNNVMDADAALDILREFKSDNRPFCLVMKHTNPCGAAFGSNPLAAYEKAFAGDPKSAFGGIIGFNCKVTKDAAEAAVSKFCEIVIAPEYEDDALEALKTKKNLRILRINESDWGKTGLYSRRVENGYLIQDWDHLGMENEEWNVVTEKKPSDTEERDLKFAWKICQYVKSNAIVYVKDEQVIGVGAGQMKRVDSATFGVLKAEEFGFDMKGAVMASDAFFPFRDSVDAAAALGVTAIIQPGGSMRDEESVIACNEHGISMIHTKTRHFKH